MLQTLQANLDTLGGIDWSLWRIDIVNRAGRGVDIS
jgi:hypothetical protein